MDQEGSSPLTGATLHLRRLANQKQLWRAKRLLHQANWIERRRWLCTVGCQSGCTPTRKIENTYRAAWGPTRRISHESIGTKLCIVAGHGSGYCEEGEGLGQMSGKSECTRRSTITPLGVAGTPLVKNPHWLCRALQRRNVPCSRGCILEVVGSASHRITSTATIEKLREMFATHGLPVTLVSDNGSNFTSSEFKEFMKKNGIKHIKVPPYHPASNGLAERAVRIFKEGYEKMEDGSVQTKLSRFLLSYRTTPHSTTGVPPAELLMKRRLTHIWISLCQA